MNGDEQHQSNFLSIFRVVLLLREKGKIDPRENFTDECVAHSSFRHGNGK
jgi:hypothetical protein